MEDRMEKLLQRYYENDYYDYREDLVADIADLDERAQQVALEARVNKMFPLIDSVGHQLDLAYPDLSVEEIVPALKYLLDCELGSSVIIYGEDILDEVEYPRETQLVGEKINSWIEQYMERKHVDFEIVEIIYVFDELIRGFRGTEEEDQFILIPESDDDEDEE